MAASPLEAANFLFLSPPDPTICILFEHITPCLSLSELSVDTIDFTIPRLCLSLLSWAMSAKPEVPDAWDADWESQADVSFNTSGAQLKNYYFGVFFLRFLAPRFKLGTLILTCWMYRN